MRAFVGGCACSLSYTFHLAFALCKRCATVRMFIHTWHCILPKYVSLSLSPSLKHYARLAHSSIPYSCCHTAQQTQVDSQIIAAGLVVNMTDVVQTLIQHDMFLALGVGTILAIQQVAQLWLPITYPPSAPGQFQYFDDVAEANAARITITKTASICWPKTWTKVLTTTSIELKPITFTETIFDAIDHAQSQSHDAITTTRIVHSTILDTVTATITSIAAMNDLGIQTHSTPHLTGDRPVYSQALIWPSESMMILFILSALANVYQWFLKRRLAPIDPQRESKDLAKARRQLRHLDNELRDATKRERSDQSRLREAITSTEDTIHRERLASR